MKKLAFLGPHGTNSEEAAIYMANLRKEKMNLVAYNTIQDAIQAVAQKRCRLLFSTSGKFNRRFSSYYLGYFGS